MFTQVLFSPEPVGLLRRAEAAALADLADGLQLTARALERDDDALAEPAMASLRDLRDPMAELSRINRRRLARASVSWPARSVTSPGRPATGRPGSGPPVAHSSSPARPPAARHVAVVDQLVDVVAP